MSFLQQIKTWKLEKDDTICVIIDFQEKILPAMHEAKTVEDYVIRLIKGMNALGIPMVVTQQYTKGLGATVPQIAEAIGAFTPIDKTTFSCMDEPVFAETLENSTRGTVILAGIEAHICVAQTALDLIREGYRVALVTDCIQSRNPQNKERTIQRLAQEGVVITTYESVLYELLGSAKAAEFKAISAIVK